MTVQQAIENKLIDSAEKLAIACMEGERRRARRLMQISNTCGTLLSLAEHETLNADYRADRHSISIT